MQEVKTTIKQTSENPAVQWESYELGNRQILFDEENESQMRNMIDDFGLNGQKELIKNQKGAIIPFPKMNANEQRIWKMYCPRNTKVEDFSEQVIPYEILNILSLVKEKKYFDIKYGNDKIKRSGWIEIWSEPSKDVDPLLVGVIQTKEKYDWGWSCGESAYYLLARWGVALRNFEDITKIAKDNYKEKISVELKRAVKMLDDIDGIVFDYFNKGNVPNSIYFN